MTLFPAVQPAERLVLGLRPGDLDHRDRRTTTPCWRWARAGTGCPCVATAADFRLEPALHCRPALLPLGLGRGRVVILGRPPLPGGLDAGRFAFLLPIIRRPRRVAHAVRLMAGGQLEQSIERTNGLVDRGAWVAPLGEQARDS